MRWPQLRHFQNLRMDRQHGQDLGFGYRLTLITDAINQRAYIVIISIVIVVIIIAIVIIIIAIVVVNSNNNSSKNNNNSYQYHQIRTDLPQQTKWQREQPQ